MHFTCEGKRMDWMLIAAFFCSVLRPTLCFNIDPVAWKSLSNAAAGFGHQVVQRESNSLLVGAPLEQYTYNRRGKIFRCSTERCEPQNIDVPSFAVNMSLGLTMRGDPKTQNTLVCGPTVATECKHITLYNGMCIELDKNNRQTKRIPSELEECQKADIAFLLDGSGSVASSDFYKMKEFVKDLIRSLLAEDTQFAVAQFSFTFKVETNFNTFSKRNWERSINNIQQLQGGTNTAAAIKNIANQIFSPVAGARPGANRVLIVITDGASTDSEELPSAIWGAERANIIRFAIGVGNAFTSSRAQAELNQIASRPSRNHVFQVGSFSALSSIQKALQSQIFPIEGSQTSGNALKMEMSQNGFSAAYVSGDIQMGVVGANQWRGGYERFTKENELSEDYKPLFMEADSYFGYSMAVANIKTGPLTILGAPRYKHVGAVEIVFRREHKKRIRPYQIQAGQYFGAEVCAMDVDKDDITDLILISAPMFKDSDREGRVYVCTLNLDNVDCALPSTQIILRGDPAYQARFGSSLAVLPDLNKDGFNDLVVGAHLENDGEGSIYIFHGERDKSIDSTYSQKIAAAQVQSGLKFFGVSISQQSFDQSGDGLPDLAVGSKGTVILLRSKPIITVEPTVTFTPNKIRTLSEDCSTPQRNAARICFGMSKVSEVRQAGAVINFTFILDATRKSLNNRAFISANRRQHVGSVEVDLTNSKCSDIQFFTQACPEDAFNPVQNELSFTFNGKPSNTNLRPSLAQQPTTTFHPMEFEINCGADETCLDDLQVDFTFSSSSLVRVGIDELLNVTVSVENREENSYNSRINLTYPAGLSYRKLTVIKGRIECDSSDSEDGVTRGITICTINKPIFSSKSKVDFIVSYGIGTNAQLGSRVLVTANVTSGNQQHAPSTKLFTNKEIDVKYAVLVTMQSSRSYRNFTFAKNLQKHLPQSVEVTNNFRALNLTVVIKVPIKLGDKNIWGDLSNLTVPGCDDTGDEKPVVTDFVGQIRDNKLVNCSLATCRVFKCSRLMEKQERKTFQISTNLTSEWIEQIGLPAAKFLLIITADIEYDKDQYVFFSLTPNSNPTVHKIETEVEVYTEPDFTKEIVGGSLGGLAFVALVTGALYKVGFFKRKYSEMINKNADEVGQGNDGSAPAQE